MRGWIGKGRWISGGPRGGGPDYGDDGDDGDDGTYILCKIRLDWARQGGNGSGCRQEKSRVQHSIGVLDGS